MPYKSEAEKWGEWLADLMLNLFWLGVIGLVIYYSNFFRHLFFNPNCNQPLLQVAFTLYGVSASILAYFVVYVCHIQGVTQSITDYNPALVYAATISGVFANVLLLLGIWPVFGLKSLVLDILLLKGFFIIAAMTPSGTKGEIVFILANLAVAGTGLYWEHEGYLHNQ